MKPLRKPQTAIYKDRLASGTAPRKQGERKPRKNRVFRPVSQALADSQKKAEAEHRRTKEEAKQLWYLLARPVYDSPSDPASTFSADAVAMGKRGRRCTIETAVLGSNNIHRAIRDFERSAKMNGNETAEVERLEEYPAALDSYHRILRRVNER